MPIKIDCYLSPSCASEDSLRENIKKAIEDEGIEAEVKFYRISEEEAKKLGLRGSPSVLINGRDIQPSDVTGFS
ncbi:MAG: thioredoxin family protein [Nitrospirae bacterium]|nr:thioredoxin family protein [Nitrospirota bacterium]